MAQAMRQIGFLLEEVLQTLVAAPVITFRVDLLFLLHDIFMVLMLRLQGKAAVIIILELLLRTGPPV